MHNQHSLMTLKQKERFCQLVFEAGIFLGKSIVLAITGENESPPAILILDPVKKEDFAKTVVENLKNDECFSAKKIIEEFMNLLEDKMSFF